MPNMENRKSLLKADKVQITPDIYIRIPKVGEVLDDEQFYYSLISSITASPYQYMVQLDDVGIDFTEITDYQLFMMLFPNFAKGDISILFGDIDLSDINVYQDFKNDEIVLYSPKNDIVIDELIYNNIADAIRKINNLEKERRKPGNEEAKKRLIDYERRKQKRNSKKPYDPYLEKLVVALVNRPEFKYNYEETDELTIYQFNQSFKQIQASITFDNTMIGVYAGTVDTSKLKDKSSLSWIPMNR